MSKKKDSAKKRLKSSSGGFGARRSRGGKRSADRYGNGGKKNKQILVGIAALLILLGFIWYFTGSKYRMSPQSGESETGTQREAENIAAPETSLNFTESQYGIEMIYARGGTFMMGCGPEQGDDCYKYEEAPRQIVLSDFYIGKYEVTQAQWRAVMGDNPANFKGDDMPVENVSWNDAQKFIEKLNNATGKTYRLPTEAEWEYAARGGSKSRGYKYSGSDNVDDVAWYDSNSGNTPHPVGTKSANELGIYDMSGNVWEWVNDWYGEFSGEQQANPKGPDKGKFRVIRGGGWGSYAKGTRVSNFYSNDPIKRHKILGFRLACEPTTN